MSFVVSNVDYDAFALSLLPGFKEHVRAADFTSDDDSLRRYLRWALAYIENELGWMLVGAEVSWTPVIVVNQSRYQTPVQPVESFTLMSGGSDQSADYQLMSGSVVQPVFLVRKDGNGFPDDAEVTLTAGFADANALPPNIEAGVYRVAATLYQNRESISAVTLDAVPFWLRDLLSGAWVPRA